MASLYGGFQLFFVFFPYLLLPAGQHLLYRVGRHLFDTIYSYHSDKIRGICGEILHPQIPVQFLSDLYFSLPRYTSSLMRMIE